MGGAAIDGTGINGTILERGDFRGKQRWDKP